MCEQILILIRTKVILYYLLDRSITPCTVIRYLDYIDALNIF